MVLITMSVMPLFNHYATTQHNHGVIMDFYDLHVFPGQTNHRLTHVPTWLPPFEDLRHCVASEGTLGGCETSSYHGPVEPPSETSIGLTFVVKCGFPVLQNKL
jgi:hypothetical protein